MNAQALEVPLFVVGTVLGLERDACSITQATNEYAPPNMPPLTPPPPPNRSLGPGLFNYVSSLGKNVFLEGAKPSDLMAAVVPIARPYRVQQLL